MIKVINLLKKIKNQNQLSIFLKMEINFQKYILNLILVLLIFFITSLKNIVVTFKIYKKKLNGSNSVNKTLKK